MEDKESGTVAEVAEKTGETGGGEEPRPGDAVVEAGEEEKLLKMLNEEKAKAGEYFNRLVRMQADFENFRKRVSREREDLLSYSNERLILSLLPVVDNFERALAVENNDYGKLLAGVEMIYRQLQEILAREGLVSIPATGEIFNPELHEAVMREEGGDYPENTVIQELRKGFSYKGKVIRAAMVKVAG